MAGYLDIDTLLCEEERIPCVFRLEVPGLGFLDPNNDSSTLPAGARVELPLWMARTLTEKRMVTMELPKHFDRKMRDNIAAGALSLNLKEYSNYYYEVGMQIANTMKDMDLKDTLRIAFTGDRYREVMVHALTSTEQDTGELLNILTSKEGDLYAAGVRSSEEMTRWRQQRHLLRPSSLIGRKRSLGTTA
eukprot:gene3973-4346_t